MKGSNKNYMFVTGIGSLLREGLTIVADKLKCSIEQPVNKKYRDAASF